MPASKPQIRSAMRQARRALAPLAQRRAALGLARVLGRQLFFRRARHIALYLANDGEIDPAPLLERAARAGKRIYLPVLHPLGHNRLRFQRYRPGDRLIPNRYGIPEPPPRGGGQVPPGRLDLVCLPLVAFDPRGNRLGMGGGFYDRTFARVLRARALRPRLVGLAHGFQQVDSLPAEPWDIPLDAIATDATLLSFRHGT